MKEILNRIIDRKEKLLLLMLEHDKRVSNIKSSNVDLEDIRNMMASVRVEIDSYEWTIEQISMTDKDAK